MDNNEQVIWAAGFLSGLGGLQLIKNNNTHTIRFQGSTLQYREGMMILADVMAVNVAEVTVKSGGEDKISYKIACSGKPLHRAMTKMWPYLTTQRKREYKKLRSELVQLGGE